jgi:hypothetical protein
VAYRQLFSVTFALGFGLAACGGDGATGSPSETNTSDSAPPSAEKPPGSSDQPPANPDQPPANPDRPPANPDQAGGGSTPPGNGNACEQFCDRYADNCPGDNGGNAVVRQLCGRGCDDLLGGDCAAAVGTLLSCVVDVPGLCTEPGPSESDLNRCTAAYQAWNSCDDDDEPPVMNPPMGCTQAGGCDCADDCTTCRCALGAASTTCDALCQ